MSPDSSNNIPPESKPEAIDAMDEVSPELLQKAFAVFSQASQQLEQSYTELKIRADRLAKELALTNEELQRQLTEKERISNFLNNILESIPSGILVVSRDGVVSMTNDIAVKMFNWKGDPDGKLYNDLFKAKNIRETVAELLEADFKGAKTVELEHVELAGGSAKTLKIGFAPVTNQDGANIALLMVIQDVTRLKLLEEQAMRTNRLAAMGEVTAELAHEIRNPLGSIEIFAGLLSRDLQHNPQMKKLADNIVIGVKSLNSIVSNMLTFTRSVVIHPERVDFNELVDETLSFLEQVLKVQNIDLTMTLSPDVGEADIDPELFKQVLLNVTQNAIYSMEDLDKGYLTVSSTCMQNDDGSRSILLEIRDTGCGIPEDDLPKIFDPFFSTRKGGTGLGLSVVSQIIEKHGGLISAESTVGKGTIMRISLPVV